MFYPINDHYRDMYEMCMDRKEYNTEWVLYYLSDSSSKSPTTYTSYKDVCRTMDMVRRMQRLDDVVLAHWLCKNINIDAHDLKLMPSGINFRRYHTYDGTYDIYFGRCSGQNIKFVDGINSYHTETRWYIETRVGGNIVQAYTDAVPIAFQRAVLKKAAMIASGEFTPEVLSPI